LSALSAFSEVKLQGYFNKIIKLSLKSSLAVKDNDFQQSKSQKILKRFGKHSNKFDSSPRAKEERLMVYFA
jgi:hypothetical protein